MHRFFAAIFAVLLFFAFACVSSWTLVLPVAAQSQTSAAVAESATRVWLVPLAPRIAMPSGTVACASDTSVLAIDDNGRSLRSTENAVPRGASWLRIAPNLGACGNAIEVNLAFTLGLPTVENADVEIDAGQMLLVGRGLRDSIVRWTDGGRSGEEICFTSNIPGSSSGEGRESCVVPLPPGLSADPNSFLLTVLPSGTPQGSAGSQSDMHLLASGRLRSMSDLSVPFWVVLDRMTPSESVVDLQSGSSDVPIPHAEALSDVLCNEGDCELNNGRVIVRGVRGTSDVLYLRMRLRSRVVLRNEGQRLSATTVGLRLLRCPVSLATSSPIRGVDGQRAVLRVGGNCAAESGFEVQLGQSNIAVDEVFRGNDAAWILVRLPRQDSESVRITVARRGTVLGSVLSQTRSIGLAGVQLEMDEYGTIGFLPTNRSVRLRVPAVSDHEVLRPLPVEGVYEVEERDDAYYVRATAGLVGSTSLRFALYDTQLPGTLAQRKILELSEPANRVLREARIPVALDEAVVGPLPMVELVCGDDGGLTRTMVPGNNSHISFRFRETCRLVFHRGRMDDAIGTQTIQLDVREYTAGDEELSGSRINRRITLRPGSRDVTTYLPPASQPFSRMIIRLSLDASADYDTTDILIGSTQAVWTVIFGSDNFRLYATLAVPTGLYRLADGGGSYGLPLNAGVLARLAFLTSDGKEWPIAVETGFLWLGIASPDASGSTTVGEAALVAGFFLGVPVTGAQTVLRTSIGLHAWVEWEFSRTARGLENPFGFIFGPSISVGGGGASF